MLEPFRTSAKSSVVTFRSIDTLPDLGPADAGVCSLWTTAYALLHFTTSSQEILFSAGLGACVLPCWDNKLRRRGNLSLWIHAICNTPSVAEANRSVGGDADYFMPCVDRSIFHSQARPRRDPDDPFVLVCYGRPATPRNCFEAISEGLRKLKQWYGDRILIVMAGADWDPVDHGLGGVVHNLGLLPYTETGDTETGAVYRAADAGLVAMATRHPSYLPLEWMACGVAVVANRNPYTTWFLRDGDNCLLCEMNRSDIAAAVSRLIEDPSLRDRLAARGEADIESRHFDWEATCERIYQTMCRVVAAPPISAVGEE